MRFGFMLLPRSCAATREIARQGEALGFDWITVSDSPTVYEDSYLHQLEVARVAQRVKVGPMVSHVVARHPVIVGNLLATLNSFTQGRAIGTLATGNSAARGLGMKPATLAELRQGVEAIQSYWRGERGDFRESFIPATGIERDGCPLLIAADGPKAAALSAEVGDGLLYGGTLDPVVRRPSLSPRLTTRSAMTWERWWWRWRTGRCGATSTSGGFPPPSSRTYSRCAAGTTTAFTPTPCDPRTPAWCPSGWPGT
jgi:alkanesulfonate monooxygenase SsuD/methylene tetrahydromethanopterin reductase-like flavin-dependent oxidoreductase (luciferase family)